MYAQGGSIGNLGWARKANSSAPKIWKNFPVISFWWNGMKYILKSTKAMESRWLHIDEEILILDYNPKRILSLWLLEDW